MSTKSIAACVSAEPITNTNFRERETQRSSGHLSAKLLSAQRRDAASRAERYSFRHAISHRRKKRVLRSSLSRFDPITKWDAQKHLVVGQQAIRISSLFAFLSLGQEFIIAALPEGDQLAKWLHGRSYTASLSRVGFRGCEAPSGPVVSEV